MEQFLQELSLKYDPQLLEHLKSLSRIAWIILLGFIALKFIDSALRRLRTMAANDRLGGISHASQRAETLRHILRSVSKTVLTVVVLMSVTSEFGFDMRPLLASAGIAGLAIGFGAQSLVKDVIAGFFVLLEDQYGVGDVVKIGEHSGQVERMTMRVTALRDFEGQTHVIPNGSIQTVTVKARGWARAVVDVMVPLGFNVETVFAALSRAGARLAVDQPDHILEKPDILGIEKFGNENLTIRLAVKTPPSLQDNVKREWLRRIKEEFERDGIEPGPREFREFRRELE